ncbi:glycosyltransferase family A protein [Jeotgalibacillus sp. R-1-5s-1]|uniref:glycosyltransferase family 2 protein n=1 Tax=Jeotgalibacillus sp. R-1-5s-1 TaxID=2555897 RepID=UPI00106D7CC1|nr:glycosyltransferase family A protein [Jeotgalibacillus sp. R-1-5s-1]TFD97100.1 glycosyltransferase family 2 protein [Jeotgalibacillus sp. R-1-5s-1]
MANPLVSIVIPTYNRKSELSELLASLVAQSFRDFEVIVVNDAGEGIEEIISLYPDLICQIINHETNQLHVHARNNGVKAAKGEYIMLIDDDDWIVSTHVETMLKEIKQADLVYSDAEIVQYDKLNGRRIPVSRELFAFNSSVEDMKSNSTFIPSGCLYKKSIHDRIGYFDPEVKNYWDWDFFLRTSAEFQVKRVKCAGVIYDFSQNNNNQSKNLDSMVFFLSRLSEKHDLKNVKPKNFQIVLEELALSGLKDLSYLVWDGKMPNTRYNP